MARPLIIGIIGEKCSGKSVVFTYLKRKKGVFSARTSDVLHDILVRLSLDPKDRRNELLLAEALRSTFGADILPRACMADPRAAKNRIVAIEGIRRLRELAPLQHMRRFRLLYVTAPVELRWRRAQKRRVNARHDDRVSLAEYRRIEREYVTEREIPRMGRMADATIENTGTRQELFRKVDAALAKYVG